MEETLLKIGKEYFNSVNEVFSDIEKDEKKYQYITLIPTILVAMNLLLNLLTFGSRFMSRYVSENYGDTAIFFNYEFPISSARIWWILTVMLSVLLFYIWVKILNKIEMKTVGKKRFIKNLPFCYLYQSVEDLKTFMVNERIIHLKSASENLNKYLFKSELYTYNRQLRGETYDVLNVLRVNHSWIDISDTSFQIAKSFQNISPKIIRRINQNHEIEEIKVVLEKLLVYELLKTGTKSLKNTVTKLEISLSDLKQDFLQFFLEEMEKLEEIKLSQQVNKNPKWFRFNNFLLLMSNSFKSKNLIQVFLSWLFLVFVLISIALYIGTNVFDIPIDSKILIGAITTPFLCAITLTVSINKKK